MILSAEDDGVRPAGRPDQCFYCSAPKGKHKPDCVVPQRTVVIEMKIRYVTEMPAAWTKDEIEFKLNESSSCADNEVQVVCASAETGSENYCNTCQRTEFQFIGEATAEDMEKMGYNTAKKAKDTV
jgi:hypothetical protein